jgi:signal transduction histidine kinase
VPLRDREIENIDPLHRLLCLDKSVGDSEGENMNQSKSSPPADLGRLPNTVAVALFSILQEKLINVMRHSQSKGVEIAVEINERAGTKQRVRDSGRTYLQNFL